MITETTDTRTLHQETQPRETLPNPPPAVPETPHPVLFQSMGQMQKSHHGASNIRRERLIMWASGIGAGAVIFFLIYAAIFFLE